VGSSLVLTIRSARSISRRLLSWGKTHQQRERLRGGDPVSLHQHTFGLADDVPAVQSGSELLLGFRVGKGDRGVGGQ